LSIKELIMIVDDEKAICEVLSQMLEKTGYKTITFYDFKPAELYYKNSYDNVDIVLMDLNLVDIKGEEAIVKLTQINPDVKVIVLSGYITSSDPNGSIFGAKRLIQKPVNMMELEKVVREVLDG